MGGLGGGGKRVEGDMCIVIVHVVHMCHKIIIIIIINARRAWRTIFANVAPNV